MKNIGSIRKTIIFAISTIALFPLLIMTLIRSQQMLKMTLIFSGILIFIYTIAPHISGYFAKGLIAFIYIPSGGNPKDAGPSYSKAKALRQKQKYYESINEYLKVLELFPDSITGYYQIMEMAAKDIQNKELTGIVYRMALFNLSEIESRRNIRKWYEEMCIIMEQKLDETRAYYLYEFQN